MPVSEKAMKYISVFIIIFLLSSTGCATYDYGQIEKQHSRLFIGQHKREILSKLGAPDRTLTFNKKEFWVYCDNNSNYILVLGSGLEHQLILEFSERSPENVYEVHFIKKGRSFSMFYPAIIK